MLSSTRRRAGRCDAPEASATRSRTSTFAPSGANGASAIRDSAVKGEEVSIPGFGKFKVQNKPARTGRNPSTGATIQIAASKKVSFQAAKALKDAL